MNDPTTPMPKPRPAGAPFDVDAFLAQRAAGGATPSGAFDVDAFLSGQSPRPSTAPLASLVFSDVPGLPAPLNPNPVTPHSEVGRQVNVALGNQPARLTDRMQASGNPLVATLGRMGGQVSQVGRVAVADLPEQSVKPLAGIGDLLQAGANYSRGFVAPDFQENPASAYLRRQGAQTTAITEPALGVTNGTPATVGRFLAGIPPAVAAWEALTPATEAAMAGIPMASAAPVAAAARRIGSSLLAGAGSGVILDPQHPGASALSGAKFGSLAVPGELANAALGGDASASSPSPEPAPIVPQPKGGFLRRVAQVVDPSLVEEQRQALVDSRTGVGSRVAWKQVQDALDADPATTVASADLKGLKVMNAVGSPTEADAVIARAGAAAKQAALDVGLHPEQQVFSPKGDEFYAASRDPAQVAAWGRRFEELFPDQDVTFKNGNTSPTGVRFGLGPTVDEADAAMQAAKDAEVAAKRAPSPGPSPTPPMTETPVTPTGEVPPTSPQTLPTPPPEAPLPQAGATSAIQMLPHLAPSEFEEPPVVAPRHPPVPNVTSDAKVTEGTNRLGRPTFEGGDPLFRTTTTNDLIDRHRTLFDRAMEYNDQTEGISTKRNKGLPGRARGQMLNSLKAVQRIETELRARGYDPSALGPEGTLLTHEGVPPGTSVGAEHDLTGHPDTSFNPDEFGGASRTALGGVAGGGLGAVYGYATGATPSEREHRAIVLGLAGLAAGATLGRTAETFGDNRSVAGSIDALFNPVDRSAAAGETAGLIRAMRGTTDRARVIRAKAGATFRTMLEKLPVAEREAFQDRIDRGQTQPTLKLQKAADFYRQTLDAKRAEVHAETGALEHYYTNYFPRAYKNAERMRSIASDLLSKRPLTGAKSFLKPREFETLAESRAAAAASGRVPISDNPADVWLVKMNEMDRYIQGQKILKELKARNLLQAFPTGRVPAGFARIEDASVGRAPTQELTKRDGTTERVSANWYAPEDVARVLNNHLGSGFRGHPLYDALATVNNSINAANLGFSAFHATAEMINGMVSEIGIGLRAAQRGDIGLAAQAPFRAAVSPFTSLAQGSKVLKEFAEPGSIGGVYAKYADAAARAGARFGQEFSALDQLKQAWQRGEVGGVVRNGLLAPFEIAGAPLMRYAIPRLKAAAFVRLLGSELEGLGPSVTPEMADATARKAWDSIDNRFGQMVLDNRFMDPKVRDLVQLGIRSVGWNVGTVDELGGGVNDMLHGKFTPRAQYTVALPPTVALLGALTSYAMTGQWPQHLKDYFSIPTGDFTPEGDAERVNLPTYIKDVRSYASDPLGTIAHKASPLLSSMLEMLQNKNFYGDQIRNKEDPGEQQVLQVLKFLKEQAMPFAVTNFAEGRQRGDRWQKAALAFAGITPAKRADVQTPAENLMHDLLTQQGGGALTPEQAMNLDARQALARQLRLHPVQGRAAVLAAQRAGTLTQRQATTLLKEAQENPAVTRFRRLSLSDAVRVYQKGQPVERARWWPLLQDKAQRAMTAGNRAEYQSFRESQVSTLPRMVAPSSGAR